MAAAFLPDGNTQPGPAFLPDDTLETGYAQRHHYAMQPRVSPRRRFWLEFSVLPHYPTSRELKARRRLEKKHRGKDLSSNSYDLHDIPAVRFPQFGRLPPEIRLLIWEYALCQPRIVVISSRYEDYTPAVGTALDPPAPWAPPPAELPALMTVCRESYASALKFYERAFAWRVPHVLVDEDEGNATRRPTARRMRPGGPGCWFNFEYDSVFLKGELEPCLEAASTSMVYFLPQLDTKRVRYVACNADDLGVGELMASQLYARLFPVIDRFEIKKCLNIVSPPRVRKQKPRPQSEAAAKAATEALTTAAQIAVTQRNPSGIGYDSSGRRRLNDTEASCMSVNASVISQYADSMNGLESYDMSNNVCQQVWDQWTNSQNMPLLTAGGRARLAARSRRAAAGGIAHRGPDEQDDDNTSDSDSGSESDSDSECSSGCSMNDTPDGSNGSGNTDHSEAAQETERGAEASMATAGDDTMDVDSNSSPPQPGPAAWPPSDWETLPAPDETHGNAALLGRVQTAPDRDGEPPQDTMRIVMVTEDKLHDTIMTIEKFRIYASRIRMKV